ncbi:hypothetical protein R1sor_009360 [Riccia sorocarpa]|uniref:Uncharacterized protein n=1 Tax=Riccia sorocarpa TaxID=122646 RepID=A0ABD3I119_9MARC
MGGGGGGAGAGGGGQASASGPREDVLLVDVEVARNSPNHPFSAVHPWPFGLGLGTSLVNHHVYVMDRLVPWLTEWSVDSSPTPDFVQSQRTRIDGAYPIEGLRRPGDRPGADLVGSVVGEPSLGPISADLLAGAFDVMLPISRAEGGAEGLVGAVADPLLQPVVVSGAKGSVGAVADPLPEPVVVSGAEGSVGAIADPLPEPVVVSGAEGSVGTVADPLPEPVVDTGAEGLVGPIPDLSALLIAQTVAELDAEGSAAPPSDE